MKCKPIEEFFNGKQNTCTSKYRIIYYNLNPPQRTGLNIIVCIETTKSVNSRILLWTK